MSWSAAIRDVCAQSGLSVVIPESLDRDTVDVELNEVHIYKAITELCNSIGGVSFNLIDNLVTFDVHSVQSVIRVESGYADVHQLSKVIEDILPDNSHVLVADGHVIVGGTSTVVDQADLIGTLIGQKEPQTWYVECSILSMNDNWKIKAGIQGKLGGVFNVDDNSSIINGFLDGTWSVDYGGGINDVVLKASIICLENESAMIQSIDEYPVPLYTVSPQGTATSTGYKMINSGITVNIDTKRTPLGLRVDLNPSVSDIVGYVEGRPIITKKQVNTVCIVEHGDVVLISGLWTTRQNAGIEFPLKLNRDHSLTEWVVCVRFTKIN